MRRSVAALELLEDATALDLLRELVAGQQRIIQLLERPQRPASGLTRADRVMLAKLLPVIGGALGSDPFLARDLYEHESAGLRLVLRGLTAQRLGKLFQRAEGQVIDRYVVERAGDELHTTLWRVLEVPGSPLPLVPPQTVRDLP